MTTQNVVQIVVKNNRLCVLGVGFIIKINVMILIFIGSLCMSLDGQPNLTQVVGSGVD